jgi:hypothetical protein
MVAVHISRNRAPAVFVRPMPTFMRKLTYTAHLDSEDGAAYTSET